MTIENHKFIADEGYLKVLTMRQFGTQAKGIIELIQNGYDCDATKISVSITQDRFEVSDNGFGFKSEEEIDKYFATVGFDHSEGMHADKKRFGRFGLGRFQIAAFGATTWRSNTFSMSTDLENSETPSFIKETELPFVRGCTVSGNWYRQLTQHQIDSILRDLRAHLEHFNFDLTINGDPLIPPALKWDYESDLVKIHLTRNKDAVSVYNKGVKVADLHKQNLFGAIVVSKEDFELNTARDNVLENKCPIWKETKAFLEGESNKLLHEREYNSFTGKDFHLFLNALLDGGFSSSGSQYWRTYECFQAKVIPAPTGFISISDFLFADRVSLYDPKLHTKNIRNADRQLLLVHPKVLQATNYSSIDLLYSKLKSVYMDMTGRAPSNVPDFLSANEALTHFDEALKMNKAQEEDNPEVSSPLARVMVHHLQGLFSSNNIKLKTSNNEYESSKYKLESDFYSRLSVQLIVPITENKLVELAKGGFTALCNYYSDVLQEYRTLVELHSESKSQIERLKDQSNLCHGMSNIRSTYNAIYTSISKGKIPKSKRFI